MERQHGARMFAHLLGSSALVLALGLHANVAEAHHSVRANFVMEMPTVIDGTVTSVGIRNPHSQYTVEVESESGTIEEWLVEWSDRNALIRRQVALDRIGIGDRRSTSIWSARISRVDKP